MSVKHKKVKVKNVYGCVTRKEILIAVIDFPRIFTQETYIIFFSCFLYIMKQMSCTLFCSISFLKNEVSGKSKLYTSQ